HSIIATHKHRDDEDVLPSKNEETLFPTHSEIPDIFFDKVLVDFKLSRSEVIVLMYIYRRVWCRPNLYKKHGISQLLSLTEMVNQLDMKIEEIHQAIRKLENFGFVTTIRVGQYFVRRFFTKELDEFFAQDYDDFEV
ncbi:hypothetical protein, partial [Bacteriovorax sp. DB6_IX]|uniref:hypothetical protein n=1 Tax=Bacteriovorax sp. DB6_IX TaxID=1353530 RepID=UPI000389F60E